MKIYKLKLLSIAIYFLVAALWSETQCAEEIRRNDEPARNYQREFPVGSIMLFAGEVPPDGWLLCNGDKFTSAKYNELYKVIGTKYVPEDKKKDIDDLNNTLLFEKIFYVPDLRGQVLNYIISHENVRNKQDEGINQLQQTEREKAKKIAFWSSGLDKDIQHLKDIGSSYDWKILEAIKIYYTSEAANKFNGDINIRFDKEELNDIYEIRLSELFISNTFIHNCYLYPSSYNPLLSGHGRPIPLGEMWSYCYADLCRFYLKGIINKKMDNYKKLKGTDHFLRDRV